MTATMKLKITPSTGNVFRNLGFRREEAEHFTPIYVWQERQCRRQETVRLIGDPVAPSEPLAISSLPPQHSVLSTFERQAIGCMLSVFDDIRFTRPLHGLNGWTAASAPISSGRLIARRCWER